MILKLVNDRTTFMEMLKIALTVNTIGIDTEFTNIDDLYTSKLLLVSMFFNNTKYVLDMTAIDNDLFRELRPVLENESILKIGHNLTVEWKQFYKYSKILMAGMHDTMICEQMLYAGLNMKFDLKSVASRRLQITMDKTVRDEFINWSNDSVFTQEQIEYSGDDALIPVEIYKQQIEEIKQKKLERIYELEMNIIAPTAMMEYTGVPINKQTLENMVEPFTRYIETADKAFQDILIEHGGAESITFSKDGYFAVNTNSPKQVLVALQKIGIKIDSLGAKILQRWDMQHNKRKYKDFAIDYHTLIDDEEIADALDLYLILQNKVLRAYTFTQGAKKLLSTFILGLLEAINETSGRIHPGFRSYGAHRTGRYSSTKPNFQNLPNDKKLKLLGLGAFSIRKAIETGNNSKLIIADYSGIELVILAVLSGDEHLMDEILRGDIHTYVTTDVLMYKDITPENKKKEPHKLWRDGSKTLSYGIAYGTTGRNIAETLNIMLGSLGFKITSKEGDELINLWYKAFPKTFAYLESNAKKAVSELFVVDTWGRRRHWDKNILYAATNDAKWKRLAAGREGKNMPIQGTSATMTKLAIYYLWKRLDKRKARIIITVHDEIVVESLNSYVDTAKQIIKNAMEDAIRETLPLIAADVGKYESLSVEPKESQFYDK